MLHPKKKLLVLGAGVFQVPLITAAQEMGHHVLALSFLPNDPGLALADTPFVVSTTDKDAVLEIARAEKIDGIITVASEVAAPTAAFVAEQLGLPGFSYEAAVTIANKLKLRQFLQAHQLSNIRFADASSTEKADAATAQLRFPLMLKPLLSSGSRGITLAHTPEQVQGNLSKAISESYVYKGALLEEFQEGRNIGGELLICNGKIVVHAFSEKILNRNFVTTAHLMPARLTEQETAQILHLLRQVISGLKLQNGALDIDLVLTENGPEIIELGGRLGGNAMAELATRHTGTSFLQAAVQLALGQNFTPANPTKTPIAAHILGSRETGRLKRIKRFAELFPKAQKNLLRQADFATPGAEVHPFTQGNHQLGNILLTAYSETKLADLLSEVNAQNWVELE